jgi:perosamine synthetase
MRIRRTIPPAAAPLGPENFIGGLAGIFSPQRELTKLEESLKSYFGVGHVFLVSSGKAALALILKALSSMAPDKNEVLIPAYTCFSVPSAIINAGLRISLCDVDTSTLDFDYQKLSDLNTDKTLCIVPGHLFGIPSDMEKVRQFAKERNIFVVEDAAQAMGGMCQNHLLGTIGDAGFFSLGRGKNITCMSGGIIVTGRDDIANEIRKVYASLKRPDSMENILELIKAFLMSVFIRPSFYWFPAGLPFLALGETVFDPNFPVRKLAGMKAGLMRNWRERLEKSNGVRRENADFFCRATALNHFRKPDTPFLRLPLLAENEKVRDNIYSCLNRKGLGASLMYPSPINHISELKDYFTCPSYPSAEQISSRLLTIPTHELLSCSDRQAIMEILTRILGPEADVSIAERQNNMESNSAMISTGGNKHA